MEEIEHLYLTFDAMNFRAKEGGWVDYQSMIIYISPDTEWEHGYRRDRRQVTTMCQ